MINFIYNFIKSEKNKRVERDNKCLNYIAIIDGLFQEIEAVFDSQDFIDHKIVDDIKNDNKEFLKELNSTNIKSLKKSNYYEELINNSKKLVDYLSDLDRRITIFNNDLTEKMIDDAYRLIGDVEGRKLDKQQMQSILKDASNHLVVAGAGTGKTTTIVGKIKYLLKTQKYKPEEILVLSFTNASAQEMNLRIKNETGENIKACTFHKLGLEIIKEVDDEGVNIQSDSIKDFILSMLNTLIKNDKFFDVLVSYLLYNRVCSKSEFDFTNETEYKNYLKMNPPTSFDKRVFKSYGEMDIANFLIKNGIKFIYEKPYRYDTSSKDYAQYRPDFYLPEYDIYIEYFGINRKGKVPSYFRGRNGKSGSQLYNESIAWKRKIHQANNTKMVECFYYEKNEGVLLENLYNHLKDLGVVFRPISNNELWEAIQKQDKSVLKGLAELFETIIMLMKSNRYNIDDLKKLNKGSKYSRQNLIIIWLVEPIYKAYNESLRLENKIDFNDMINLATDYVDTKMYISHYKYVIVDEYQDISKSRFNLLKALRNNCNYDLFCVGDDWQSIYRFNGSDISYILDFDKYWGASENSKIETTYRFSQPLIDVSSSFIMKNPMQIKKKIKGNIINRAYPLCILQSDYTDFLIEDMCAVMKELPKNATVFLIGRYLFDFEMVRDSKRFKFSYNNSTNFRDAIFIERPDLKIECLTVHKSKGLQADYVFIINNKFSRLGFPSQVQDNPILYLLLDNDDSYSYAEERRLFYVAMTRAKKKVFFNCIKDEESVFIAELLKDYPVELRKFERKCPVCGAKLVIKKSKNEKFLACSNYWINGCRYTENLPNANFKK